MIAQGADLETKPAGNASYYGLALGGSVTQFISMEFEPT